MSPVAPIRPANHPFPFLLYMEWALLAIAILSELTPTLLPRSDAFPAVAVACIIGFGGLGLWLPMGPMPLKVGHVVSQFGLIMLASHLGIAGLRLFPLLYIVLVIRSCLLFRWWWRLAITGIAFVSFLVMVQLRLRSLASQLPVPVGQRLSPFLLGIRLNLVLMFAIMLVFVLLLVNALLAERQRRDELRLANQKLRDSAAQIEKLALAQERSRIAREIHDALGHSLTGLNIQLEGALKLWQSNPEQARQFVAQAKTMGSTALREVRQAVVTLRDAPLSAQPLDIELANLAQHFQSLTGITPQVSCTCPPLTPALRVTVYRILQEALTNACKYAQATALTIILQPIGPPQERPQLHISVQDNGQGFHPQDNTTGFGLKGIQERAEAEGGRFRLTSAPGAGCRIQVWLPLPLEIP